ncbi:CDP-alcohol phosphatidyltransferase family protein [Ciceribacter sp. L1K23]|uniref:CDP-alcohol phosphatidyltransferase family protein n=1 Tax=Ciceribacter sp. L1K23 TaxID=2820276 RepID=UPI001B8218E4|nr:CDP-alcohol phosphatidyltransferase family protein [Ciceribacter sp. L1K23]MBR0558312.1 CDP-alcohol phosphatidyltransferase family protein [Ciceribacter sp. L1K23]
MPSSRKSSSSHSAIAGEHSPALRNSALTVLGSIFVVAMPGYVLTASHLSLGILTIAGAAILLLIIFALVVAGLRYHRFERFGFANTVTAIRAALVSMVAAVVLFSDIPRGAMLWSLVVIVLAALALDGVDGYLARRYRQESELGARFDMEIDALLIFCLAVAAFLLGKAGLWVLLIGVMRYAFVLAQYPLPRLKDPLPPSYRRKLVCVIQVSVLCIILVPGIDPPVSSWLAAAALLLLTYSFVVDSYYLLRPREHNA